MSVLSTPRLERRRCRKRTRQNTYSSLQISTQHNANERWLCILNSGIHSDVCLLLCDTRIRVHKCILAEASPVFKAMLSSQFQESQAKEIRIDECEASVMKTVMSYIYSGRLILNHDNAVGDKSSDEHQKKEKCHKKVRFKVDTVKEAKDDPGAGTPRLISPPGSPIYPDPCDSPRSLAPLAGLDVETGPRSSADLSFLFEVILAADKFQVDKLGKLCQLLMCETMTVKDVAGILVKIQPYLDIECVTSIQKKCIRLIVDAFQEFRDSDGFNAVMDNHKLRDLIFDDMAAQNRLIEKQRLSTEGFYIVCQPIYEEDWLPFKVKVVHNESLVVLKAKIIDHMNLDYSFAQEAVSVKCYYDEVQTQLIDSITDVAYIKTNHRSTVYVERGAHD